MKSVRRLSIVALIVACLHLVFGAIVRISGSGMGCGDNWPKCYGYWFPPFTRPDLIVEVSHRYLASILVVAVSALAFVAFRNRRTAGVGGRGGPLRSAFGAVAAVFGAAILGGITVKMGNVPWATVAHWLMAMALLAMVTVTAIRAGALGGSSALVQRGTVNAARWGFVAAFLAIFAVAFGGLTAKMPGAAVGCTTIPFCGPNPGVEASGVDIQMTHRTIAVLLGIALFGTVLTLRKRRETEAPVVVTAAYLACGMVVLQIAVASAMILYHLPIALRSLHEAIGVAIWLSCFALAYLAHLAAVKRSPSSAEVAEVAEVAPMPEVPEVPEVPIEAPPAEAPIVAPVVVPVVVPQVDPVTINDDRVADAIVVTPQVTAAELVETEAIPDPDPDPAPTPTPAPAPAPAPRRPAPTMAVIIARGADM